MLFLILRNPIINFLITVPLHSLELPYYQMIERTLNSQAKSERAIRYKEELFTLSRFEFQLSAKKQKFEWSLNLATLCLIISRLRFTYLQVQFRYTFTR